jgi:membrane protein implicated in regulation of membrane protease activity
MDNIENAILYDQKRTDFIVVSRHLAVPAAIAAPVPVAATMTVTTAVAATVTVTTAVAAAVTVTTAVSSKDGRTSTQQSSHQHLNNKTLT